MVKAFRIPREDLKQTWKGDGYTVTDLTWRGVASWQAGSMGSPGLDEVAEDNEGQIQHVAVSGPPVPARRTVYSSTPSSSLVRGQAARHRQRRARHFASRKGKRQDPMPRGPCGPNNMHQVTCCPVYTYNTDKLKRMRMSRNSEEEPLMAFHDLG